MEERTATTDPTAALSIDRRLATAEIVQRLLVDLTDLSLHGKQAHWNVRGRSFRDLHLLLDELVDSARDAADTLAERCLALGVPADARAATVGRDTRLPAFPEGRVEDHQVVDLMVHDLHTVSEAGRSHLGQLGELDPVSQDLVIGVLENIEKQLWMFDAHRPYPEREDALPKDR
jgi:starvation-inducible DNA-binding protein